MHDTVAAAALAAIEAWRTNDLLAQTGKQSAVIAYGQALMKGRETHASNQAFGDWIAKNKLDQEPFHDRRERTAAMAIAEIVRVDGTKTVNAQFADCPHTTPSNMMTWARENGLEPPPPPPVVAKPFEGNLDVVIAEFGKGLGLDLTGASWPRRKYEIEALFTKGTEHLRALVGRGPTKVGLESAAQFAANKSHEEQDRATIYDVRGYRTSARGEPPPEKRERREKRAKLREWKEKQAEIALNTALRRAQTPKVSDAEFERPPPDLIDKQYPGREAGITYGTVHRETHGPIWHNVGKRRKETAERKLKDLAADTEKAFEEYVNLDPGQQASVRKRWKIAMDRIAKTVGLEAPALAGAE